MEIHLEAIIFKTKTMTVHTLQKSYIQMKQFQVFHPFISCSIMYCQWGANKTQKNRYREIIFTVVREIAWNFSRNCRSLQLLLFTKPTIVEYLFFSSSVPKSAFFLFIIKILRLLHSMATNTSELFEKQWAKGEMRMKKTKNFYLREWFMR